MGQIRAPEAPAEDVLELVTDLTAQKTSFERRFKVVPIKGLGNVRLRSLSAGELDVIRKHEGVYQTYAAICLCVVDASGNTTHPLHEETFEKLKGFDSQQMDALSGAINGFVLNQIPLEELLGN